MNHRRAFTLIELLVVIAIIAILAAILFPVFAQAKAAAKKSVALSNVKQLATANMLYMTDYDDVVNRKWWDMHVDLMPYVKSIDVFLDPASCNAKPVQRTYACVKFTDDFTAQACSVTNVTFWTNVSATTPASGSCQTLRPCIFCHFSRNDELLHNFGFAGNQGGNINTSSNASTWTSTSDKILLTFSKDGASDNDTNDFDDDNAPYFEPGGTNWNEIYAIMSVRHTGGAPMAMLDSSAKWRSEKWLRSMEGKKALNPACSQVPDGTAWSVANCTFQE